MHLLYAFAQPEEIAHGQDGILREEVEEGDHAACPRTFEVAAKVGHDDDSVLPLQGELTLDVEGADGLDLVAEEVDTERILRREGEDVDDAAAQRILTRLVDVVRTLEAIVVEDLSDERHVHLLPRMELEGLVVQLGDGHDLLCQRIGIGDDSKHRVRLAQAAEDLGAEYLAGGVLLTILDGAAERRGKEEYLPVAQHLHEVVVEVACLFRVAQDEDERHLAPSHQDRSEQRCRRGTQAAAVDVVCVGTGEHTDECRDVGMGGIALLEFTEGHNCSV